MVLKIPCQVEPKRYFVLSTSSEAVTLLIDTKAVHFLQISFINGKCIQGRVFWALGTFVVSFLFVVTLCFTLYTKYSSFLQILSSLNYEIVLSWELKYA